MTPIRPPRLSPGRLAALVLLVFAPALTGSRLGAQEAPAADDSFAVLTSIEPATTADGFTISCAGRSTLPPNSCILLAIFFQGYELTPYWTRCYVADDRSVRFTVGPVPKRCLGGTYVFDLSFDPTAQDLSLPPTNSPVIRHAPRSQRIGAAEDEQRDRAECTAHFEKLLNECDGLRKELEEVVAAMKAGKRFMAGSPPKPDSVSFNAWAADFRARFSASRSSHISYVEGAFAHYYAQETLFTTPGLFDLIEVLCFHELIPLCKKGKLILPEWMLEIKRRCESIPMLPPPDTIRKGFLRDLRLVREAVGLLPVTFALKDVALTRKQFEPLGGEPEGGALRKFDWAAVPPGLAESATELPALVEAADLGKLKSLEAWTYPGIPRESLRGLYHAALVENPPPDDSKLTPARLTVLGFEYVSQEVAVAERGRIVAALNRPPTRNAYAVQRGRVVVVIIYEGRDDLAAAWQFLNTWFSHHME